MRGIAAMLGLVAAAMPSAPVATRPEFDPNAVHRVSHRRGKPGRGHIDEHDPRRLAAAAEKRARKGAKRLREWRP